MAVPKLNIFLVCLFVLTTTFVGVLEAANLQRRLIPGGELGVRLDYNLAIDGQKKKTGNDGKFRWLFSSYLEFEESVASISPGQLQQMAIDAHKEMRDDIKQYKPQLDDETGMPIKLPTVMSILAFDNKIILSSSQKGAVGFISSLEDSPVKRALNACQTIFANLDPAKGGPKSGSQPDHMFGRSCGEIFAFHQYDLISEVEMIDLKPKARVLAVGPADKEKWNEPAQYKEPCGTGIRVSGLFPCVPVAGKAAILAQSLM